MRRDANLWYVLYSRSIEKYLHYRFTFKCGIRLYSNCVYQAKGFKSLNSAMNAGIRLCVDSWVIKCFDFTEDGPVLINQWNLDDLINGTSNG